MINVAEKKVVQDLLSLTKLINVVVVAMNDGITDEKVDRLTKYIDAMNDSINQLDKLSWLNVDNLRKP